ncbi:MAG TPA: methyl-accepting chemotaxis protein [Spirochaetota bacterium]|nr:methyl-accepting chemotaxis protein [Spirochaetota bacterium]HPJ34642.1 methyl-accepting chemotaxis protein [Spirochaetota bacterium]
MNRGPVENVDENKLKKSEIFSDIMHANNRRMVKSFLAIMVISNIAVILIKITGKGSEYLNYKTIVIELLVVSAILLLSEMIVRKHAGTIFSGYITLTSIFISLSVFQTAFFGAPELFAANYIALTLSIFYFNPWLCIYSLVLVIIAQTASFMYRPELIPGGPASNLMVRYILYLMVGLGATTGATAARHLLKLTVAKHNESLDYIGSLKEMARSVHNSIILMKKHATEQEEISTSMNGISENQAAALKQITGALDNLTTDADAVNSTSRSLYEEMNITVEAINDLKTVNDSLQGDSLEVQRSLGDVLSFSEKSFTHIETTRERFNTVQTKSREMSNFIQLINDIADNVNLLSLNASIEAARAGTAGRGFAIVAEQISKLADETTRNSKEIERIINESTKLINESTHLIEDSSSLTDRLHGAIDSIKKQIDVAVDKIGDIDITIKTIRNLNDRVHNFSRSIEEATSDQKLATEESSRTTSDIASQAGEIVNISKRINESTRLLNDIADGLKGITGEIII